MGHAQSDVLTIPDALIAATAKLNDLKLVTRNRRPYVPIKNLDIEEAVY